MISTSQLTLAQPHGDGDHRKGERTDGPQEEKEEEEEGQTLVSITPIAVLARSGLPIRSTGPPSYRLQSSGSVWF